MNLVSLFKFYLDLESLRLLLALHNQETVRILVYGGSNITKSLPREMRPSSLLACSSANSSSCWWFGFLPFCQFQNSLPSTSAMGT